MKNLKIIIAFSLLVLIMSCKSPSSTDNTTVYITNTGKKFHASTCQYLDESKKAISHSDACAQGYTPCSVCNPPACK